MSAFSPKAPATYADWTTLIDMLRDKADDENVLLAMSKGRLEWQQGVAERFSQKLIDAVNFRMNGATDRFRREMSRCAGQEREIVQALLSLRKELSFLARVFEIPALPDDLRGHYRQLVVDQADKIQRSLEDSAKSDRTGKLASIVRNNRVNSI